MQVSGGYYCRWEHTGCNLFWGENGVYSSSENRLAKLNVADTLVLTIGELPSGSSLRPFQFLYSDVGMCEHSLNFLHFSSEGLLKSLCKDQKEEDEEWSVKVTSASGQAQWAK